MLPAVLSSHVLAIAAIFVPYLGLMVGLGAYIWRTGQPGDSGDASEWDDGGDEREPDGLLAAA